jgi:hypothetical protein
MAEPRHVVDRLRPPWETRPVEIERAQSNSVGSSTKTGIWRVVRFW